MKTTKIEWTDRTWNPVTGCDKISPGCLNCYAEVMSRRLKAMGQHKYRNGFEVTTHPDALNEPTKWIKPHNIFVCSMSDLFHDNVPADFIDSVLDIIEKTPHHTYQILTKRPKRMSEYFKRRLVPANAWIGVTIDVRSAVKRLKYLNQVDAKVKFLSCEPLLEDLGKMDLSEIDWVIVGGESGVKARPMQIEWVLSLKAQAEKAGSSFFFKQWGTWGEDGIKRNKKKNGSMLQGIEYKEIPPLYNS